MGQVHTQMFMTVRIYNCLCDVSTGMSSPLLLPGASFLPSISRLRLPIFEDLAGPRHLCPQPALAPATGSVVSSVFPGGKGRGRACPFTSVSSGAWNRPD